MRHGTHRTGKDRKPIPLTIDVTGMWLGKANEGQGQHVKHRNYQPGGIYYDGSYEG